MDTSMRTRTLAPLLCSLSLLGLSGLNLACGDGTTPAATPEMQRSPATPAPQGQMPSATAPEPAAPTPAATGTSNEMPMRPVGIAGSSGQAPPGMNGGMSST